MKSARWVMVGRLTGAAGILLVAFKAAQHFHLLPF